MSKDVDFLVAKNKLESYGYPADLCDVVHRFSQYVLEVFSELSPGVLLVGSTARGELSWTRETGDTQLFSDIEFIIALTKHNLIEEKRFEQIIIEMESEYNFGSLFHIDFTFITWKKLPRLDKKFFIFESKCCGIEVGHKLMACKLPTVTRSNISWKELNEVLLHRLTSMLHIIPESFFDAKMSSNDSQIFALNLAKNTLDITTWLHPYEAKALAAGVSSRLSSWDNVFLANSELGRYFSNEDIDYLRSCLDLRKSPLSAVDIGLMMRKTLSLYDKAISYCKYMNKIDENNSLGGVKVSAKLFDEYNYRQRAYQLVSMLRNISTLGIYNVARNVISVRKGSAINICHNLLTAAFNYRFMNDHDRANHDLDEAKKELLRLSKINMSNQNDFSTTWIDLRKCFSRYQKITHNQ